MAIDSQDWDLKRAGELTLNGFCCLEVCVYCSREISDSRHHFADLRTETSPKVGLDEPGEGILVGLGCLVCSGDVLV